MSRECRVTPLPIVPEDARPHNLHCEALAIAEPNKFERQGLIKALELAWKTLQNYLKEIGIDEVVGPKPVIRRALSEGLIGNGMVWQAMHQARNESAHLYNEDHAQSVEQRIRRSSR